MSRTLEEAIATYEQYVLDAKQEKLNETYKYYSQLVAWLRELQERRKAPEIVCCKDCVKHNQSYGNNGAIDSCPLVLYRGKAQGHEFDYQYCAFAERRTDG